MLRKILKRTAIALITLLALLLLGQYLFMRAVVVNPPQVDGAELTPKVDTITPDVYVSGDNWLRKDQGDIWVAYISGEPYERGLVYGKLCGSLARQQEDIFVDQTLQMIGSGVGSKLLRYFVAWFNRDIDAHIPLEFQQEIYGVSRAFSDEYDWIGSKYQRLLNYHAAHDIGHAVEGLVKVGCSSFAISGPYTADRELLVGRNFDFYMGRDFSRQRLLLINDPSDGYAYASYAWAGMMGVVSGLNEKGITVTINAARSDLPTGAKTPISILAREVLQYASSIGEAVEICRQRELFVSESILVGSGNEGRSAIIEVSPAGLDVFESETGMTLCTNHYQSTRFRETPQNVEWIETSDSRYRFQLLDSLLRVYAPLDPPAAAMVLEDTRGLGNKDFGLANPKVINQLIGHHSIIFRPSQEEFWISAYPNPLVTGFYGYNLDDLLSGDATGSADSLRIMPDSATIATYGEFDLFAETREKLLGAVYSGQEISWTAAQERAFIDANPNSYLTYMTLGQYYQHIGDCSTATELLQRSLGYELPSLNEEANIKELLSLCE